MPAPLPQAKQPAKLDLVSEPSTTTSETPSGDQREAVLADPEQASVRAQVLGAGGQALIGIQVTLQANPHGGKPQVLTAVSRAPDGIAEFPTAQSMFEDFEAGQRFEFEALVLTWEPVIAFSTAQAARGKRLVLTCPPLAEVEVRVLEVDWKPYLGPGTVHLTSLPSHSQPTSTFVPPACSSHALSARCGRAQAPAVALPPVAPGADLHDLVAGGAVQSAMALWLLALGHVLATKGWT